MKKFTKVIAAIMLMTAAVFTAGCKPEDSNNEGGNGTYNGHEYVDLGLPSGTLWATCNVGANIPEKFAGYRHGLELSWVGSDVAYWSSSLSTDNQDYAWSNSGTYDFSSFGTESLDYAWDFGLGSVGECLNPNPRWVGFSVRPVRSTR